MPLKKELDPYKPILKFLAIKSTVFLTFWQDTFLGLLVSFKVIKSTEYWTATHIQVGLNALLTTFEMVIFALLHVKAFTYIVYRPRDKNRTTTRWRAFLHAADFRDWFFEMKDTTNYYVAKAAGRNYSYVEDVRAQKYLHLQAGLGKSRDEELKMRLEGEKESMPTFWKDGLDHGEEDEEVLSETDASSADLEKGGRKKTKKGAAGAGSKQVSNKKTNSSKTTPSAQDSPFAKLRELEKEVEEEEGLLDYAARVHKNDKAAQHPELTLFHRPPLFDGELGPTDKPDRQFEEDFMVHDLWTDAYDHGKRYLRVSEQDDGAAGGTGGHKKQNSWWRSFRERISGSWGGDVRDKEDGGAEEPLGEKEAMIQEEAEGMDEKRVSDTAAAQQPRSTYLSAYPDQRFSMGTSPLEMIIGGTVNGAKPKSADSAPQFLPLQVSSAAQVQTLSTTYLFNGSTPEVSRVGSPSGVVAFASPSYALSNVQHHEASAQPEMMVRSDSLAISSAQASFSGYTSRGHQSTGIRPAPSASASHNAAHGAAVAAAAPTSGSSLRWADQKGPSELRKAASTSAGSTSAANVSRSGSTTVLGPKGKKINLVMPTVLSPSRYPGAPADGIVASPTAAAEPAPAPVQMIPRAPRPPRQSLDSRMTQAVQSQPADSVERWRSQAAVVPPSLPVDNRHVQRQRADSQPSSNHPESRSRSNSDPRHQQNVPRQASRTSHQQRHVESPQTRQAGEDSDRRNRRTSAPPAPAAIVPDQQKRKGKDRYDATSNIPAPSQLGGMANSEDPFAAGAHALDAKATPEEDEGNKSVIAPMPKASGPKHPHLSSVQPAGGSAFSVGSIVSPMALAQAAPTAQQLAQRQPYPGGFRGPAVMPMPMQRASGPPPFLHRPPPMPQPQHHPRMQAPGSRQQMYDRWSGEPVRGNAQPRQSQPAPPSRDHASRPRQSAPGTLGGFGHVEYID